MKYHSTVCQQKRWFSPWWSLKTLLKYHWNVIENMINFQQFAKSGDSLPGDHWTYAWHIIENMNVFWKYYSTVCKNQVILSLVIIGAGFQLADNRSPGAIRERFQKLSFHLFSSGFICFHLFSSVLSVLYVFIAI